MDPTSPPPVVAPERRLATERLIWRFRAGACAFAVAQTLIRTGDDARTSWAFVALFVASVVVARSALAGSPSPVRVRSVGAASMAVDAAIIASTLCNNLGDPADPIFMVAVLGILEASVRWRFRGGALAGLAGGIAAAAWTWAVDDRLGQPLVVGHATMRLGVLVVLGLFIGSIVQRLEDEHDLLETSEQRLRSLFEHSTDAVWSLDLGGCLLSANPATLQLTGYDLDELRELGFARIVDPRHLEEADRRFRLAAAGDAQSWDAVVRNAGGWSVEVDVTYVPIIVGAEVVGVYGVGKDVTERRRMERQLGHQARHDALTGLPNRLVLDELLQLVVEDRRETGVALLFIDLDRFKVVNDSLGHRRGDDLLVSVVGRLQSCLRTGDVLVRWAGDEFCAVLPSAVRTETAVAVAERMLAALEEPIQVAGRSVHVSASIGVAVAATPGEVGGILLRADQAMYEAKRAGRGRINVYASGAAVTPGQDQLDLEARVRRAVEQDELVLAYQPVVEIRTGHVIGFESLVRWHPTGGTTLPPSAFIPLAEETGLIRGITRWALGEACRQLAAWDRLVDAVDGATGRPLHVGVNVSAVDLAAPALVEEVTAALAASGLLPGRLVLEVTETTLITDPAAVRPTVDALRALGVLLAIDDFGVGYSSLSQLRHLPVSVIKVDGAFLDDVGPDSRGTAILGSLRLMSEAFGLPVVAEGVERSDQLDVLLEAGFVYGQGHLFGPPGTPAAVEGLVRSRRVALPAPRGGVPALSPARR